MQALAFCAPLVTMFRASRRPHASRCPNAPRCIMDKPNPQDDSSRRDFLKGLTTFPFVALLGAKLPPAAPVAALSRLPTAAPSSRGTRSEEHTSELQSLTNLVCRL